MRVLKYIEVIFELQKMQNELNGKYPYFRNIFGLLILEIINFLFEIQKANLDNIINTSKKSP